MAVGAEVTAKAAAALEGGGVLRCVPAGRLSRPPLWGDRRRRSGSHLSLGGRGLFGVEFFCRGDTVWFSEVSPRPHDTGMVTMVTLRVLMPMHGDHSQAQVDSLILICFPCVSLFG